MNATTHLFFDGETAAPKSVAIRIVASGLQLIGTDGQSIANWPSRAIRVVSENALNGLLVLRLEPDSGARVQIAAGAEKDAILAQFDLKKWRRRERLSLAKGFALWGSLGAIACVAFYLAWGPASVAIAERMPEKFETRLGDMMEGALVKESRICKQAGGRVVLESLVKQLLPTKLQGKKLKIIVVKSSIPNAFAIPDRRIVVFSGLIDMAKDPDMLAGVLAHEMAHAELRHPVRGMVHNLGVSAVFGLVFGDSTIATAGQVALALSYTRDIEREADARGIELLKDAGLKADGLSRFLDLIANSPNLKSLLPDFLSTHPDMAERVAATRQPPTGKPAMDSIAWNAVKIMCKDK